MATRQTRNESSSQMSSPRFPPPWAKARRFRKWVALTLRQPYQCMVPAHGSSLKPPPRHHTRRRGRPIPRRLLLGWSERVRIRQRLRAHICAGSGRTPGATPKKQRRHHARTSTRVFRKPASFLCAYVYLEGGARQVRGGQAVHPRRGPASPSISSSCRSRLRLRSRPAPLSACVLNRQFEIRR